MEKKEIKETCILMGRIHAELYLTDRMIKVMWLLERREK
jgi:hypothetical protein